MIRIRRRRCRKGDPPNLLRWLGAPQCESVVSSVLAFIGRETVAQFVDAAVAIRNSEEPNLFLNDDQHGHVASPNQKVPVQLRHYNEALRRCVGWRRRKDFLFGYYEEEEQNVPSKKPKVEENNETQT
ncbi:hypothetical protein OESDEN_11535 [Oesophagostomum dentatum]|uniref:Uncharacterized protein n=1 Tax=Oesophagostomum dentatum TaxID=61180 RepID=A0A0B1SZV7_OESDE|nr:hypothetical protein OESDEN_11535 [Oesophagostomum dentatum]